MEKKQRTLCLLLALALVLALAPATVFAAGARDAWDGTADTAWYDESKKEFHITTAEQLAGMARLILDQTTHFKDQTVYLDADLDLSGHEWISIGNSANMAFGSFQGVFDGQNHVIYNLYSHEGIEKGKVNVKERNLYRNGLFGSIFGATIQNLGIENADIVIPKTDTSTYGKGILVDWMTNSTLKNCYTTGSITGGSYIEKFLSGMAGFLNGNNTISQCYSSAVITGNYDGGYYKEEGVDPQDYWDSLGGIVSASWTGKLSISDCWFDGKIVVNSIQAPVGGIIGYGENVDMSNCLVATNALGDDGQENTCWLGYVVDTDAKNCFWYDDDKYPSNVSNALNDTSAGTAVRDFLAANVLSGLKAHAGAGVEWVEGIKHPTFRWDERNISADYSAVDAAVKKATALNKDDYKDFSKVSAALAAVVPEKSMLEQDEVDAMAQRIEDAIRALEKKETAKPTDPIVPGPDLPPTGDGSHIALWIALLFVSAAGLLGTALTASKRKANR